MAIIDEYTRYKISWKWNRGQHLEAKLTPDEASALLNKGGYFVRNAYNFDCKEETSFWYIIKDSFNGMEDVPSKYRNRVRKSLEKYEFKIVSKSFAIEKCFEAHKAAAKNYKIKTKIPTNKQFDDYIKSLDKTYDIWVGIDKESGCVAGLAINHVVDDMCDYDRMKFHPDFLKPVSPSYGLIYCMNEYYLVKKGLGYVCEGARSITEHSEIQSFLETKFKFRKAYCQVQMFYKWWFRIVINVLFPFRSNIKAVSIKAMLNMVEIARNSH